MADGNTVKIPLRYDREIVSERRACALTPRPPLPILGEGRVGREDRGIGGLGDEGTGGLGDEGACERKEIQTISPFTLHPSLFFTLHE